jgi:hypothetical protein
VIPPKRISKDMAGETLCHLEDLIRYRLRVIEPLPVAMANYTVETGHVRFHVQDLFELSMTLTGAELHDGWQYLDVVFLFNVVGDIVTLLGLSIFLELTSQFTP